MQKGDLVISADFGTSGVKVGVVDGDLHILARATETYPINLAPGGIAEQTPEDFWAALARAIATLRNDVPDLANRTGTLVFSSQVCGVICADENGVPLRPCLTWLDKRAAQTGRDLIEGFPSAFGYRIDKLARWINIANGAPARNGMDPTAKFLWIAQNEPEIFQRTRWLLDVKDWLVHRATGRFTTCAESANLTWLMDTRPGREGWSESLSRLTGISLDRMPEIVEAEETVGTLTPQAASELGLPVQTPLLGGTSDVTAAALGSGEVSDGGLHICAATSCWIAGFMPGRVISPSYSFATITSSLDFRPLLIASQENAGSALEWAVRMTGGETSGGRLNGAFDGLGSPVADDPFFLPWLAGERVPVDNDALRGVFHGLALHHDARSIRRAALEGVALNLRWSHTKVVRKRHVNAEGPINMVGGVADNPVFAQMVADALNREVWVGEARHAGVLGTATLAARLLGWADDAFGAASRLRSRTTAIYAPDSDRVAALDARYARLDRIRDCVIKSYRKEPPS